MSRENIFSCEEGRRLDFPKGRELYPFNGKVTRANVDRFRGSLDIDVESVQGGRHIVRYDKTDISALVEGFGVKTPEELIGKPVTAYYINGTVIYGISSRA